MAYSVPGFMYPIEEMDSGERERHLDRVGKQKKREAEAMRPKRR